MIERYYGVVYKMTNMKNGMVYIGQTTKRLKERLWNHIKFAHRKDRQKDKKLLHQHINEYGKESFKIEILKKCKTKNELDKTEIFYTEHYRKNSKVYNIRTGQTGGFHSESSKLLCSESHKGLPIWNKDKKCPQLAGKNNGMFGQYGKQSTSRAVICLDLNGNKIKDFISVGQAVEWLKSIGFKKANSSPLSSTCRGERKTLYGYKWKYA